MKPSKFKTFWGVRHIRYVICKIKFAFWWSAIGCQLGAFPNPADFEVLDRIWNGKQ